MYICTITRLNKCISQQLLYGKICNASAEKLEK